MTFYRIGYRYPFSITTIEGETLDGGIRHKVQAEYERSIKVVSYLETQIRNSSGRKKTKLKHRLRKKKLAIKNIKEKYIEYFV